MSNIIDLIISGIQQVFTIMQNFEFLGTNMLKFSITILIIGAMLPVLLTLLKNANSGVERSITEKRGKDKKNDN